jgi:hypothetical protein
LWLHLGYKPALFRRCSQSQRGLQLAVAPFIFGWYSSVGDWQITLSVLMFGAFAFLRGQKPLPALDFMVFLCNFQTEVTVITKHGSSFPSGLSS